ncbi:hypothetical protein [Streptosporangium subroseum]|uniref:hypothetical protein n=1 Tax=Streptosporangium subroseum TaxID=106412 RepID=UPI00308A7346|nr:hypothetical protein OHB15_39965 [Streptosporangium subroseum]
MDGKAGNPVKVTPVGILYTQGNEQTKPSTKWLVAVALRLETVSVPEYLAPPIDGVGSDQRGEHPVFVVGDAPHGRQRRNSLVFERQYDHDSPSVKSPRSMPDKTGYRPRSGWITNGNDLSAIHEA